MRHTIPSLPTSRRNFTLMMSAGILGLSNQVTEAMWEGTTASSAEKRAYWTIGENRRWWWYERHQQRDHDWRITGITTPLDKKTNQAYTGRKGYLDVQLVSDHVRNLVREVSDEEIEEALQKYGDHTADAERKARDGRPPSDWILNLTSSELRVWLRTIEVPEVGVSGMTCWCHLTRDHSFAPEKIEGLTQAELDELHAAAHFGY